MIQATNTTETKTKRGLIGQTFYYGEPPTRYIQAPAYQDSSSSAATQPTSGYYNANNRLVILQNPSVPIKPEGEATKPVTVQQILYEYQQTPQHVVSNIPVNHVHQPFQTTTEQRPEVVQPQFVNQPNVLSVEPNQYSGIITPVQHGAVIQHAQRYNPKIFYNPYNIQTNNQQRTPYITHQNVLYQQPIQNNNNNHPYTGTTASIRPYNYLANLNFQQKPQVVTQKPFKPSPLIPITYKSNYQTHPASIITTTPAPAPAPAPVKQNENEDTEDKEDVREEQEEDEDSEDHSNYEEEDDDDFKPSYHSKYRYEDDDDEDHAHYREEDEDEDNTRSYTKYVKKSPKRSSKGKKEPRYHKSDNYRYKEGFQKNKKYSSAYKTPETDYISKKPKNQYKSYKYYKSSSNHSPRKEVIEGHQSQNVPVIHNKKVVHQEKWLITKKD